MKILKIESIFPYTLTFKVKFKVKGRKTEKVPLKIVQFSKFWHQNIARVKF